MGDRAHREVSAAEAIAAIEPGGMVFIEGTCGEPRTLVDALVDDKERLKGTHLLDSRVIPGSPYAGLTDYFHIVTMHVSPDLREGVQNGTVDFLPVSLTQTPSLFTTTVPLDAALVHVSPPDDKGYCSFGAVPGFNRDAALNAGLVIAQVNQQMPYTYGDSLIHVSDIDYMVQVSRPVQPWPEPKIGDEEKAVARVVAERINELPEVPRKVLAMYYYEDMRLAEIAAVFGLTESRICQIHSQAILSLRTYLTNIMNK